MRRKSFLWTLLLLSVLSAPSARAQTSDREIVIAPSGTLTLQQAIDQARPLATAANPMTIRMLPGLYVSDVTINATGLTGVRFVGAGRRSTIIGGTKTWGETHRTGGAGFQGYFDVSGCNEVSLHNLTVDATYGDDGTMTLSQSNALSGILHDTMSGNLLVDSCDVHGFEYAMSAGANANANVRVDLMNSSLFGNANTIRSGSEKWHIFSCDLRGTKTNTGPSQTNGASGLQFLGSGEFQVWGSHIHAEDRRTVAGGGISAIAGVRMPVAGTQPMQILGSTIHVKVVNDAGGADRFGAVDIQSNVAAPLILVGCDLIYETGTMTQGIIGGITMPISDLGSSVVRMTDCSIRDNGGSGGGQRGWIARQGSVVVATGPTIDISGSRWYDGISTPTTQITLVGRPATPQSGTATLASGTKTILLLTDSGNSTETNVTFTNGSASVTGGTNFAGAGFKPGMFTRRSAGTDADWIRIKNVAASTLTLESNYTGTGGAGSTAKLGTPNTLTQNDAAYRLSTMLATNVNETLNVITRKPGLFIINSSNPSSTATVDWELIR